MNSENIFIFIILLLGFLILFIFLGKNNRENFTGKFSGEFETNDNDNTGHDYHKNNKYDNYNHFSGLMSSLTNGSTFYGNNGGSVTVNTESDGKQSLKVQMSSNTPVLTFTTKTYSNKFFGPNDELAYVISHDNQTAIKVISSKGTMIFISSETQSTKNKNEYKMHTDNTTKHNKHYSDFKKYNNTPNTYYGSTGDIYSPSSFINNAFTDSVNKSLVNPLISPATANNSSGNYNDTLPRGIPRSQIPPGQEDLYILKSEIVPPVCPACPQSCPAVNSSDYKKECPPCPACARCPEPSFECKKVPNYNAINNEFLPVPVLSDFSSFGM